MRRRLPTRKTLIATLGLGAVSYVTVACGGETATGGNLNDSGAEIATSGNLMGPIEASTMDVVSDVGADISTSGNLMGPTIEAGPDTEGGCGEGGHDAGDGGD